MPLPARPAARPPLVQPFLYLLATMREFPSPDNVSAGLVKDCETCGPRSGINLKPPGLRLKIRPFFLQHDGERKTPPDGGMARVQQKASSAGMDGGQGPILLVKDKNPGHTFASNSDESPLSGVKVPSSWFASGHLSDALAFTPHQPV
jgi:hypothetical protein